MVFFLEGQSSPITSPSVQSEEFPPSLMLLTEVLRHTAADLGKRAAHHTAEVALWMKELALFRLLSLGVGG